MKKLLFFTLMSLTLILFCDCRSKPKVMNAILFKTIPVADWYYIEISLKGTRHVEIPGTYRGDFRGYPVDRQPDIGAYEYSSPTCNEDLQRRIFPYIDNTDPDENFHGDMNWDGLVNYQDYWILGSWWVNYDEDLDPNTILPYPFNAPPLIS